MPLKAAIHAPGLLFLGTCLIAAVVFSRGRSSTVAYVAPADLPTIIGPAVDRAYVRRHRDSGLRFAKTGLSLVTQQPQALKEKSSSHRYFQPLNKVHATIAAGALAAAAVMLPVVCRSLRLRASSQDEQTLESVGMCPDCGKGAVWTGEPKGTEMVIGGLNTYVASPSEVRDPKAAILYCHDIMGFQFTNARLLADRIAEASGIPVYVPDFFEGDKVELDLVAFDRPPASFLEQVSRPFKVVAAAPSIISTVSRHPPAKTEPRIETVLTDIQGRHGGEGAMIGMVGYCWGGKYALRLGKKGKVAVTVACHPSSVDPEADVAGTTAPTLFLLAKGDNSFSGRKKSDCEAMVAAAGVPTQTVEYVGVKHGFTVRGDISDPVVAQARDDACTRTAEWFVQHLIR